jgi:hypothetical protein
MKQEIMQPEKERLADKGGHNNEKAQTAPGHLQLPRDYTFRRDFFTVLAYGATVAGFGSDGKAQQRKGFGEPGVLPMELQNQKQPGQRSGGLRISDEERASVKKFIQLDQLGRFTRLGLIRRAPGVYWQPENVTVVATPGISVSKESAVFGDPYHRLPFLPSDKIHPLAIASVMVEASKQLGKEQGNDPVEVMIGVFVQGRSWDNRKVNIQKIESGLKTLRQAQDRDLASIKTKREDPEERRNAWRYMLVSNPDLVWAATVVSKGIVVLGPGSTDLNSTGPRHTLYLQSEVSGDQAVHRKLGINQREPIIVTCSPITDDAAGIIAPRAKQ